jgi:hypothetical protein
MGGRLGPAPLCDGSLFLLGGIPGLLPPVGGALPPMLMLAIPSNIRASSSRSVILGRPGKTGKGEPKSFSAGLIKEGPGRLTTIVSLDPLCHYRSC